MDVKETMIKMEDPIQLFSNPLESYQQKSCSSLGFMELLGLQDFNTTTTTQSSSIFDMLMGVPASSSSASLVPSASPVVHKLLPAESWEVLNNEPTTPNCSSISSASSNGTGVTDDLVQGTNKVVVDEEGEENHTKTKKQLKAKKTSGQKKQREPRFAFMTKSEVDHLEDGYRWRKYGQKAVKNSSFPRSYYRCTSASCNVKKRVERSFTDPSIVVTTYEGQHIHPSPTMMPRPPHSGYTTISAITPGFELPQEMLIPHQISQYLHNLAPVNINSGGNYKYNPNAFCDTNAAAALLKDHGGLLQDIVPCIVRKEG